MKLSPQVASAGPWPSDSSLHTWSQAELPWPATWGLAHVAFLWQNPPPVAHGLCSGVARLAELPGPPICHLFCHSDSKDTWITSPWRRASLPSTHRERGLAACPGGNLQGHQGQGM